MWTTSHLSISSIIQFFILMLALTLSCLINNKLINIITHMISITNSLRPNNLAPVGTATRWVKGLEALPAELINAQSFQIKNKNKNTGLEPSDF